MAYLDPQEAFQHLRDRVVEGITRQFPIRGKQQSVHLEKIEVRDVLHPDDIKSQHQAKVTGDSWAEPVYATISLRNNASGGLVETRRVRVAEVPKMTKRYSYIVDGQEYQIDNQWQLKPGAYVRRNQNNEVVTKFNVTDRNSFDLKLDPKDKQFRLSYNKSKLPLYPIIRAMGVSDEELEKSWGKEIFDANKGARGVGGAVERFYKSDKKVAAPSKEEAVKHLVDTLAASRMRPDSTVVTLGKPFENVTGEALQIATKKMLQVQAGHPEDDRDSLAFKDLRSAGDFAFDKLKASGRDIQLKARRQLDRGEGKVDLRDVVKFDLFNKPLRDTFHKNSAARVASQINPVEMVSSSFQTTIMGPGGIQSDQAITDEAKFVNPSHMGFLDPIHTPEGDKTGVTLRLPIGIKKIGNEPHVRLFNLSSGKMEWVSPSKFITSNVVLPDQVSWKNGVPTPLTPTVKMSGHGNESKEGKFEEAHYVLRHASQLFNMTSNLIPFLGNTSGNRASMASRHIEQAISLMHREAPLVQVATGVDKTGLDTFEKLLGRQASHVSPVDGVVSSVKPEAIVVQSSDGKKHDVSLYHHYPLNDAKGMMTSTPLVQAGDKVHVGQLVGDTNFSKNGTLALGTNLRVGYIPFKGYNFEDGVVISDSAAKKLSSEHLHKHDLQIADNTVLDRKAFEMQHLGLFTRDQLGRLDDRGVVKVGQRVKPGDPLIAAMKPFDLKDRFGIQAIRRSMTNRHADASMRWDSDYDGEVVGVHRTPKGISVHVRTVEPMQVGDKLAGRYGNKGIVTMVLPDKEMPHTKDGQHVEVALNPSGVPGRMNIGQVLETAAAKIAKKTGKPYIVHNFLPNTDVLEKVKAELKQHGLSDTEELFDPATGKTIGQALVGPQHMLKLVHQVDKKLSVRSGMSLPGSPTQEHYDMNLQPTSGGGTGGQSMGTLGMYAMLAHGATANIREMQTWKSEGRDSQSDPSKQWSSQHADVWKKIQFGHALPTPRPTFAFQKFTDMIRGAGINLEKNGNDFVLTPLTDKHILDLASEGEGANKKPRILTKPAELVHSRSDKSGDPKPKAGGLFDEKLTGGHGGQKWSVIQLAEPIPNPVFEGPIRRLTGLGKKDYVSLVHGEMAITSSGKMTDIGKGLTGGEAIKFLLDKVDVKRDLVTAQAELKNAPRAKIDGPMKRVKYLQALDHLGLKPSEAYVLHYMPIIPPSMRAVSTLPSGDLKWGDINQLYSQFAQVNTQLKDPVLAKNLTDSGKKNLRKDFYDGIKAIVGIGTKYENAEHKGLIHQISGSSPKDGYFQDTLMNRRQDLSMRSTIVPEPSLGLDEVGLPQHAALKLFSPFVVRRLTQMGAAANPLEAQTAIAKVLNGHKNESVWRALDQETAERPVLMKRDPALHKYSVQAFRVRTVPGNAIQIHPLVTGGYNADFDGDTMSVFVPIHQDAVAEAHKMFPSHNLFSEATGKVAYQPTLESALGLYKLSLVGKESGHKFDQAEHALAAVQSGKVGMTDLIHVGGEKTTPGRVLLAAALPEAMKKQALTNLDYRIDKSGLDTLLTNLAKGHQGDFGPVVNKLKDLGNDTAFGAVRVPPKPQDGHKFDFQKKGALAAATVPTSKQLFIPVATHTLSLNDFTPDKELRDRILGVAQTKVNRLQEDKSVSPKEKERRTVDIWNTADKDMRTQHEAKASKDPDNLFMMYKAGVKPGWDQYKQMKLAPMLLKDSADRTIPTPVTKSYAEGLDVNGYWTQMHGARRGSVMKVQEVREPGYMSKLLMQNTMHLLVTSPDCGTEHGVALDVGEKDIHDRHLAQAFTLGKLHLPAGTMLSPDIVSQIKSVKKDATLVVRSPLKCEHEKGLCQQCVGLSSSGDHHPIGTNIGVHAAHAVGERAVQLTLKSFHTGGVVEQGGGRLLNSFARFEQLTRLPKTIPDAASLAMTSGTIQKVEQDPTGVRVWVNDVKHHIGKDSRGNPLHIPLPGQEPVSWRPPEVGMHVKAGQSLSDPTRTYVNPHNLYQATKSIEAVQNHMTNEIYDLYKDEGIKRRAVEVVVKSMSNLTRVHDPGDHPDILRGEFRPTSVVKKLNRELVQQGKRPIVHEPVLRGVEMMPLALQEDWMAKLQHQRLKDTLLEAAAVGAVSHLHENHPVPAAAFGAEFGNASRPGHPAAHY